MLSGVIAAAKTFMTQELGLAGDVTAVDKTNDGWLAVVEAIHVDPEMRRIAKKDLVITFELRLNRQLEIQAFSRKAMRERGAIVE